MSDKERDDISSYTVDVNAIDSQWTENSWLVAEATQSAIKKQVFKSVVSNSNGQIQDSYAGIPGFVRMRIIAYAEQK